MISFGRTGALLAAGIILSGCAAAPPFSRGFRALFPAGRHGFRFREKSANAHARAFS
ncbi:hypothetical protein LFML04_0618 [Leptospirillum ferriphilum ML-04]|uniref:Lipoprotein n=1 Tax=Leptospirillum ferriphilum (strain ML-04) TaxID=1048260 RepID=J9ZAH7_LEPFM|nr:hypothetical protein LFML04_0618 [Leptospirillum ferriphilum ML-04]